MENQNKAVRVIITTRNNKNIIKECLDNINKQNYGNIKITVIDDASTDDTISIITKFFPQVEIIKNKTANGPAKNRNIAAKRCQEDWILFMDSDAFPDLDWIKKAIDFTNSNEAKNVGILGGKVYFPASNHSIQKGRIQCMTGFMYTGGIIGTRNIPTGPHKECIWLPSCVCLVNREIFEKIGGFDEDFFYLIEDNDLCWRMFISGYRVVYLDNLNCVHKLSQTAKTLFKGNQISYMIKRNKIMMLMKNYEPVSLLKYSLSMILTIFLELIFLKNRAGILAGNLSGIFQVKAIIRKRKDIQKLRKVPDRILIKKFFVTSIFEAVNLIRKDGYV